MSRKSTFLEHLKGGGIGVVLAVFFGLLFLMFPMGQGLSDLSYDLPFIFRPDIKVDQAVLVYMDDESHREFGPTDAPWNDIWNRKLHAQLVRRLTEMGARVIVFDVLFDTVTTNDHLLVEAAKAHGKVVLVADLKTQELEGQDSGWTVVAPVMALREVSQFGISEAAPEDNVIRQHNPGIPDRSELHTVASLAAALTMKEPPAPPTKPRWINYYGPPGTIRNYSYADVWGDTNLVFAAAFSNKVVFVGASPGPAFTGGKSVDVWRTPYTRWTGSKSPGVEINATTYLNLWHRDWLTRLSPLSEFFLFILLGVLFGFGLSLCRPMRATAMALLGIIIIAVAAHLFVWQKQVWFSWGIVAFIQIPCALGWSMLWNSKNIYREKELLEKSLARAHAGAALAQPASRSDSATRTVREQVTVLAPDSLESSRASQSFSLRMNDGGVPPIPDHTMLRRIGQGAYGEVWLARDVIGSFHAVKIIYRTTFSTANPYEREFKGIQKFTPISRSHPGFVHILHVGRNDTAEYFYYIMEAGDDENSGQNIDPQTYSPKNLAREISRRGKISLDECLSLGLALTAALEHLHQEKLIHRDIKPSNIIFVKGIPKLADIGLVTDIENKTGDTTYLGTEGYIAPEGPGTPAADVYSLGKVLYEASMGRDRMEFPELSSTLLQRPDKAQFFKLNEIIVKACQTRVGDRYQSAAEMHADLLRLSNGKQLHPRS